MTAHVAIAEIRREFTRHVHRDDLGDVQKTYDGTGYEVSARHFGQWLIPRDVPFDEREDYDWKEPSRETMARLDGIAQRAMTRYPTLTVTWVTSEKEWVTFSAVAKQ